jgi:hypothetical protein
VRAGIFHERFTKMEILDHAAQSYIKSHDYNVVQLLNINK